MPEFSFRSHLTGPENLITTYEDTRAGFIQMALEKNRRAVPYIAEARALKVAASLASKPMELLGIQSIRPALLTASGLSDKALGHLDENDKTNALKGLIEEFLEPAGDDFVEELIYRFLLIKGDSLGGTMRNIAGFLAEIKLKRAIVAILSLYKIEYQWLHAPSKKWLKDGDSLLDIDSASAFFWLYNSQKRIMVFNKNVPIVKNNIDVCVLEGETKDLSESLKRPEKYVMLGELKGGIDPAGADEHWKTARTALERISKSFGDHSFTPKTFFVGAAIETKMATEIWTMLENNTLSNACNLTSPDQLASLCSWLVVH